MFKHILLFVILPYILNLSYYALCDKTITVKDVTNSIDESAPFDETLPINPNPIDNVDEDINSTTTTGDTPSVSPETDSKVDDQSTISATSPSADPEEANATIAFSEGTETTQMTGHSEVDIPVTVFTYLLNYTESNDTSTSESTPSPATLPKEDVDFNTSTPHSPLEDQTSFRDGINGWNFHGMWGRYNLTGDNSHIDIPAPSSMSSEGVVLLTLDTTRPYLTKSFPGLKNGKFYVSYFVNCSRVNITGNILVINKPEKELFKIEQPVVFKWVANSYRIKNDEEIPFTIMLGFSSDDSGCVWAIDFIGVTESNATDSLLPKPGTELTTSAEENTTTNTSIQITTVSSISTPSATENFTQTTESMFTTTQQTNEITKNSLTSTQPPDEASPEEKSSSKSSPTSPNSSKEPTYTTPNFDAYRDSTREMSEIASTMWTAIYVFLVLFCLCLLVFIVVAFRQWRRYRRENPESNPTVSTYNPRASTYQLDKMRENPAYETDTV